jgi:hypothetical protein
MNELIDDVLDRMRSSGQSEAKAIEELLSSIRYQYDDEEWPSVVINIVDEFIDWAVVLKHVARRCRSGQQIKEDLDPSC